jgi:hypothetical protein
MTQKTYPDGFPLTPLEAIEFSYTFSNQEKNEWREWVKTATPEQQQELVDTLHSIWIENQKEVIPSGFSKDEQPIQRSVATERPESPQKEFVENISTQTIKSLDASEKLKSASVVDEVKVKAPEVLKEKEFVFNEKPSNNQVTKPVGQIEKPIQQNRIDETKNQQRVQNNQQVSGNKNNDHQNSQSNRNNQNQNSPQFNLNQNKQDMNFFDFTKIRESATRNQLEKLQKEFVSSRQKKYEIEQTYTTQLTQLTNELDQKQQVLFDKVVQISLNFENVADYLQLMTEKLLKTNESNIVLEKKVRSLEILLDEKIKNLSYDKENTQHDIDRLFREMREMRESLRGEIFDIKKINPVSSVDSFGDEGVKLKLDILSNKLAMFENNFQNQGNQIKPSKELPQIQKSDSKEDTVGKKSIDSKTKVNNSDEVLDISDIV